MMPQGEWTEDGWKEVQVPVSSIPSQLQQIQASDITKVHRCTLHLWQPWICCLSSNAQAGHQYLQALCCTLFPHKRPSVVIRCTEALFARVAVC